MDEKIDMIKITEIKHQGLCEDGTFKNGSGGAVTVTGAIVMSENNGCGLGGCNCSPGFWLSVFLPRTRAGTVRGYLVGFGHGQEMRNFMKDAETRGVLSAAAKLYGYIKMLDQKG